MQHAGGLRRLSLALAVLCFVVASITSAGSLLPSARAAQPGDRVDLKVLVLSADGAESSFQAWTTALKREGVPFDTIIAKTAGPITAATLAASATHARYQAVILATGGLLECSALGCFSALDAGEWTALDAYQSRFGVRRVVGYAYPTPEYGLNWPFFAGELAGTPAQLTTAGKAVFSYLAGPVQIDTGAYGYHASPLTTTGPSPFTTLVAGPVDGSGVASSIVGVHSRADGFEELVITVANNPYQMHALLLAHGLIHWVTGGVYLGYQRNYFTLHIDDVFVGDDRWDSTDNVTYEDDGATNPVVRMVASDVTRALKWQAATGLKMDLVFNGVGSVDAIADNGSDALTAALLANKAEFRWINHTYSHPNLNTMSQAKIYAEIDDNLKWAYNNKLTLDPRELVTGEHSGLTNPAMAATLAQANVLWVAADNSYDPNPFFIGATVTVPRHPSNVYYNVGTFAEQLDEYNYIYFDNCTNTATTTCLTAKATYAQYVNSEATIMLRHLLTNDPRPHYFHQSNLAEDGTLYPVADEVLKRYTTLLSVPLYQPTFRQSSLILARQGAWATGGGAVSGWVMDGKVYVQSGTAADVPITGAGAGSWYGGTQSGWFKVAGGATAVVITAAQEASLPDFGQYGEWQAAWAAWVAEKKAVEDAAAKKAAEEAAAKKAAEEAAAKKAAEEAAAQKAAEEAAAQKAAEEAAAKKAAEEAAAKKAAEEAAAKKAAEEAAAQKAAEEAAAQKAAEEAAAKKAAEEAAAQKAAEEAAAKKAAEEAAAKKAAEEAAAKKAAEEAAAQKAAEEAAAKKAAEEAAAQKAAEEAAAQKAAEEAAAQKAAEEAAAKKAKKTAAQAKKKAAHAKKKAAKAKKLAVKKALKKAAKAKKKAAKAKKKAAKAKKLAVKKALKKAAQAKKKAAHAKKHAAKKQRKTGHAKHKSDDNACAGGWSQ